MIRTTIDVVLRTLVILSMLFTGSPVPLVMASSVAMYPDVQPGRLGRGYETQRHSVSYPDDLWYTITRYRSCIEVKEITMPTTVDIGTLIVRTPEIRNGQLVLPEPG
jgi:hypothetical protein